MSDSVRPSTSAFRSWISGIKVPDESIRALSCFIPFATIWRTAALYNRIKVLCVVDPEKRATENLEVKQVRHIKLEIEFTHFAAHYGRRWLSTVMHVFTTAAIFFVSPVLGCAWGAATLGSLPYCAYMKRRVHDLTGGQVVIDGGWGSFSEKSPPPGHSYF